MAVLTTSELTFCGKENQKIFGEPVDYSKAYINAALQAIEDWYQANKAQGSTNINTATSPYVFTNIQKKKLFGLWMEIKFKGEKV